MTKVQPTLGPLLTSKENVFFWFCGSEDQWGLGFIESEVPRFRSACSYFLSAGSGILGLDVVVSFLEFIYV